jgi:hypothetical protein
MLGRFQVPASISRSSQNSFAAPWLDDYGFDESDRIRCQGPPGFMDSSTSDEENLSERITRPESVNICALSREERKTAAPVVCGIYERLFLNGNEDIRSFASPKGILSGNPLIMC